MVALAVQTKTCRRSHYRTRIAGERSHARVAVGIQNTISHCLLKVREALRLTMQMHLRAVFFFEKRDEGRKEAA